MLGIHAIILTRLENVAFAVIIDITIALPNKRPAHNVYILKSSLSTKISIMILPEEIEFRGRLSKY